MNNANTPPARPPSTVRVTDTIRHKSTNSAVDKAFHRFWDYLNHKTFLSRAIVAKTGSRIAADNSIYACLGSLEIWCWDCKLWLPVRSFCRSMINRAHDQQPAQCRKCMKVYNAKKRATPEHRLRMTAMRLVEHAVQAGTLKKQPCEVCGGTRRLRAHHDNYEKPLEVRWFCPKHHYHHHKTLELAKNRSIRTL